MNLTRILVIVTLFSTCLIAQAQTKPDSVRVLIAMEQTEFKKKLVSQMKPLLAQKKIKVTVVQDSEKDLHKYNADDFDLVFITNSGVMSHVRPWVLAWIDSNRTDSAKILLHTTKRLNWQENVYVDAVSSASASNLAPELAKEYVTRLVGKR
jgi:hypothetical protein